MSKLGTRHAVAEPGSEHSCPHAEASLRPRREPSRGEWRPSHCLGSCEGTVQTHRHDGTRAERLASASPAVLVRTRAASPTPRAATRCASRRRGPRLYAEAGTALPSTEAGDGGRSGSLAFVFRPVPSLAESHTTGSRGQRLLRSPPHGSGVRAYRAGGKTESVGPARAPRTLVPTPSSQQRWVPRSSPRTRGPGMPGAGAATPADASDPETLHGPRGACASRPCV